MDFWESIHLKYLYNLSKYPDLADIYSSFDSVFLGLFWTKADNIQHDMLLRLLSSMRRSYLLWVFLFWAEQSSSWIQSMRTMIESWELICSCLIDPQSLLELIWENIEKDINDLQKIRNKILLEWLKKCSNESIKETFDIQKDTKNKLNSTISHANPMHNLIAWSWNSDFDFEFKKDLYLDWEHGQSFFDYFLFISSWLHSLLLLIYQIWLETNSPYIKSSNINTLHDIDEKFSKLFSS